MEGLAAYQVVGKGNGLPSLRRVSGVRARTDRGGLRHGPHSYGRQQQGILRNGLKGLTQRHRVGEEGFRVVNPFSRGRVRTVPEE